MTLASKAAIFAAQDWDCKEIDVPSWGRIKIRSLSAQERLDLAKQFSGNRLTNEEACNFFCRLIAMAVVDEDGRQVFDLEGDIQALSTRNWARLKTVADEIMSFNGMNESESKTIEKN